uniref:Cytochrome c biogenesis FC n=1 Tax=Salix viminalis TaxID=40686 RepID=A0A6N2N209_SALVM
MVVPRGTAAPVLLKWFFSRDVPIGAPSSNGTIIPIPISLFPLLIYLHSRKFIRSMDGAKSGVLVRASRPILLPDKIRRSSPETRARNALFRFVPVLHFLLLESKGDFSYLESFCGETPNTANGNEQRRNDKMRCSGHPHLKRRVEGFGPLAFPVPPSSGERGVEALALPTSRQLMAVGHDYYQKAPMKMNISHGGVCIFMLGVLLSCDPAAYVQPVAHASYLFRAGGVNSDSIRVFNPAAEMLMLTTLRDTKAQVTPVGEVALSIPSGTKREGTGKFPLPLAGQPGRERGGNGLPKKPAPGRGQHRMKGMALTNVVSALPTSWLRPDRQLLGLPISSKLPPVFGPSCMRQKLVSRTVRRPSPTPAVMVRLRSTNTKKIQFTQRLPLGSELHMGKERCCLRGLDHLHGPTSHSICGNLMIYKPSLTNDRLMFEHDESLRADLLLINFPASYENGKLEHFLHRWMKNRDIISGGSRSLLRQLKKDKLRWYRESSVEFIIAKKEGRNSHREISFLILIKKQHPNHTQPLALKNQYPENGKWQERKGVSGDDPTFMYESQWAIKNRSIAYRAKEE